MPALDRDEADGAGHAGVRDLDDGFRRARGVEPEGMPHMREDSLRRRADVETRELVADRAFRVDAAEHHVGVGQRRARVAAAVAGRPGSEPALSGPTWRRPPLSTLAIEPPPAPIVVISIMGVRMTRPKSMVVCAESAVRPSAISDTSKEVRPDRR